MNDAELERRLRELRIPPASAERRAQTLREALWARREPPAERTRRAPSLRWLGAGAGVALALLLVLGHPFSAPVPPPVNYDHLFTEFEALFPTQLEAVVSRGAQIDLQLAAVPGHVSDQRLLLEFTRGTETIRVLAYSGGRVCVDLPERVCFEVLLTTEGTVVLSGDELVWTSEHATLLHGYRLSARPLPRSV